MHGRVELALAVGDEGLRLRAHRPCAIHGSTRLPAMRARVASSPTSAATASASAKARSAVRQRRRSVQSMARLLSACATYGLVPSARCPSSEVR